MSSVSCFRLQGWLRGVGYQGSLDALAANDDGFRLKATAHTAPTPLPTGLI